MTLYAVGDRVSPRIAVTAVVMLPFRAMIAVCTSRRDSLAERDIAQEIFAARRAARIPVRSATRPVQGSVSACFLPDASGNLISEGIFVA
jgi:hypothetical protein